MTAKSKVTGIRYSDSEKQFLDSIKIGFQRTVTIGLMSLKLSLHYPGLPPCIYLSKKAETLSSLDPRPAKREDPGAHCCACCPIRLSFSKLKVSTVPAAGPALQEVMRNESFRSGMPGPDQVPDQDLI
jgi:hypothetical protein